jgi:peptidoglycan/xylan/chitin deacetylase (PgdA/CDA1 family)
MDRRRLATAKKWAQHAVRALHLRVLRDYPDLLGVYFHDLPRQHWPAFVAGIEHLRELGYTFGGPRDLLLTGTDGSAGRKIGWISFDDNYLSWYEALGLFDDLGVRATFYVSTLPIRDRSTVDERIGYAHRIGRASTEFVTLSASEIVEIDAAGHTIGCHAHSHHDLAALDPDEARAEILTGKLMLEDILGHPVVHFAYPYGVERRFTDELRDYCLAIGFETVANAMPGMQYAGHVPERLQRTHWDLSRSLEHNLANLRVDGRLFAGITGRSPLPA